MQGGKSLEKIGELPPFRSSLPKTASLLLSLPQDILVPESEQNVGPLPGPPSPHCTSSRVPAHPLVPGSEHDAVPPGLEGPALALGGTAGGGGAGRARKCVKVCTCEVTVENACSQSSPPDTHPQSMNAAGQRLPLPRCGMKVWTMALPVQVWNDGHRLHARPCSMGQAEGYALVEGADALLREEEGRGGV